MTERCRPTRFTFHYLAFWLRILSKRDWILQIRYLFVWYCWWKDAANILWREILKSFDLVGENRDCVRRLSRDRNPYVYECASQYHGVHALIKDNLVHALIKYMCIRCMLLVWVCSNALFTVYPYSCIDQRKFEANFNRLLITLILYLHVVFYFTSSTLWDLFVVICPWYY